MVTRNKEAAGEDRRRLAFVKDGNMYTIVSDRKVNEAAKEESVTYKIFARQPMEIRITKSALKENSVSVDLNVDIRMPVTNSEGRAEPLNVLLRSEEEPTDKIRNITDNSGPFGLIVGIDMISGKLMQECLEDSSSTFFDSKDEPVLSYRTLDEKLRELQSAVIFQKLSELDIKPVI